MRRILFLSVILILIACKQEPPISEEKFIEVYSSLLIMRDTTNLSSGQIIDSVLSRFEILSDDYERTIEYYNTEPERWKSFFNKAETYIDSLKSKNTTEKL